MAKGLRITDDVRALIGETYLKHPDWIAKQILAEVHKIQGKRGWPGLSAVQKELTKIREKNAAMLSVENSEERPWNLATLNRFPISTSALPSVLKVWVHNQGKSWLNMRLSIREAKWAARLYSTIEDTDFLTTLASVYAFYERIAEITNSEFDSTDLDLQVYSIMIGENITDEEINKRLTGILLSEWGRQSSKDFASKYKSLLTADESIYELLSTEDTEARNLLSWLRRRIRPYTKRGTNKPEEAHNERTHSKEG